MRYNDGSCDYMTTSMGAPVSDNNNSLTVGPNHQVLLQDVQLIDKLAHFNRERIPERVVHAKGAGAFGFFQCYNSMSHCTMADFLSAPGKQTKVFVRFSTVIGSKGSADTVRDPRGFAVKFYTNQGIYDLVGNSLPVFFIRDSIKFPDVIHSLKPNPVTNTRDPERFWDFISLTPEATNMITWLYSDRGTICDYAHMEGFGVNTYVWVNAKGVRKYVKYHWKTMQGVECIDRHTAEKLAGKDPDIAVKNLRNRIACGKPVRYELCVQLMDPCDAHKLPFDPLDDTKVWSEKEFPLTKVGMLVLNKNPENFFAQVEQSAFCPGNIVPGIEFSADKMLQGRSFGYTDAQRYRVGPNFAQLPINKSLSPVNNNEQDGPMTYEYSCSPINYSPNSLNGDRPLPANLPKIKGEFIEGKIERKAIQKTDDFTQAGERYRCLSKMEKAHLVDNIAVELCCVKHDIAARVICFLKKADTDFGERVECEVKKCQVNMHSKM